MEDIKTDNLKEEDLFGFDVAPEPAEEEDYGENAVFDGTLSDEIKTGSIKVMRRSRSIKFFILSGLCLLVALLMYNIARLNGGDGNLFKSDGAAGVIAVLILTVIFLVFAIRDVALPVSEKEKNEGKSFKVVFDKEKKEIRYTLKGGGQTAVIPFLSVSRFEDMGDYYSLKYVNDVEEVKGKKRLKHKKVQKTFTVICQKSLLKNGSLTALEALMADVEKKRKAAEEERRKNVKKYAVYAIVLSLIGVAIIYPLFKLGIFIMTDYMVSIFERFFGSGGAEKIVLMLFFGIFVVAYWAIVGVFALLCFIVPIPLFVTALVNVIIQLVYNRRWFSWVALAVFLLSAGGGVAIVYALFSA